MHPSRLLPALLLCSASGGTVLSVISSNSCGRTCGILKRFIGPPTRCITGLALETARLEQQDVDGHQGLLLLPLTVHPLHLHLLEMLLQKLEMLFLLLEELFLLLDNLFLLLDDAMLLLFSLIFELKVLIAKGCLPLHQHHHLPVLRHQKVLLPRLRRDKHAGLLLLLML